MPRLIEPDIRYSASYAAAMREGLHLQPSPEKDICLAETDFNTYLKERYDLSRPVTLPDGRQVSRVPQYDWWLVDDEKFLGMASIRPQLNETLNLRGGNIGYAVRASERKKGYGSMLLTLGLPKVKAHGLDKILITCHDENHGSIRIIESHGGVLEDKVEIPGSPILERRYWIKV